MPRPIARSVALLAAVVLGTACSRPESTPAAQAASVPAATKASAGATAGGLGGGSMDSLSNAADRGRIRGADTTKVWLIEVSDFQCPYCKRWHDEVYRTIDREYVQSGKVRVAYINFPLNMHANAQAASEAAMCASAQGRFWELHDGLYDTQQQWEGMKDPMPLFDSLAVASRTNPSAWRGCMASHATAPLISADRDRAGQAGVSSTPSFFVGNRGLIGVQSVAIFRAVLDSALATARGTR